MAHKDLVSQPLGSNRIVAELEVLRSEAEATQAAHAAEIAAAQDVASGLTSQISTLEAAARNRTATIATIQSEAKATSRDMREWSSKMRADAKALAAELRDSRKRASLSDVDARAQAAEVERMRSEAEATETALAETMRVLRSRRAPSETWRKP